MHDVQEIVNDTTHAIVSSFFLGCVSSKNYHLELVGVEIFISYRLV